MTKTLQKRQKAGSLAKYSPKKGLAGVDIADAAIKHYARACDAAGLDAWIEKKLTRQSEFVFWWDTKGPGVKPEGGRPRKTTASDRTQLMKAGRDGLPPTKLVSRWRKALNTPEAFKATLESTREKFIHILEGGTGPHVSQNSGENEWYTPSQYAEAAHLVMGGIDLDPASSAQANAVIKATRFFSIADDGLSQPWAGRIWMNPPYATPLIERFCARLAETVMTTSDITQAVVLVNNATETKWFVSLVNVASALCFPTGRVCYWSPRGESAAPLQGQAVLYVGPNVDAFAEHFAVFGFIAVPR